MGIGLLVAAVAIYAAQVAIFHAERDTYFYLFQDLAFLPVQVLLVTLVLNAVLVRREKDALLKKMNMVIGAFFSDMGTPLLQLLPTFDQQRETVTPWMLVRADWTPVQFRHAREAVRAHKYVLRADGGDLAALKALLLEKRAFLLGLLENPNLLEHESFTELLWAVSHLTEELSYRSDLQAMPKADAEHIAGDIRRAYALLLSEWLGYCRHLQQDYPYILSLVIRTNPFDAQADPVIR